MKIAKTRWIRSVIDEAARSDVEMPWTRGARRRAFIARRAAGDGARRLRALA